MKKIFYFDFLMIVIIPLKLIIFSSHKKADYILDLNSYLYQKHFLRSNLIKSFKKYLLF